MGILSRSSWSVGLGVATGILGESARVGEHTGIGVAGLSGIASVASPSSPSDNDNVAEAPSP